MSDAQQGLSTTPILDTGILPRLRSKKRILGIFIGLCVGLLFGKVVTSFSSSYARPGLTLFIYFANLLLVVTVHELAHLLAGLSVGFHFNRLAIGPLSLRIEYGRLKIQFNPILSGALGYAGMNIRTVRKIRRRLLIYIAAGPAANLVTGVLAGVFARYPFHALQNSWLVPFAAGFSLFSILIGLVSLVPYGSTLRSDGARIRMLLTSVPMARRWIAAAALADQQRNGVSAKNWKRTWLKTVCSVRDSSIDEISGNTLAYLAASANKDFSSASIYLERCLELAPVSPVPSRDLAAREAAILCAWFRNELSLAERWSAQIRKPKLMGPLMKIRLSVSLDCARRSFEPALAAWRKGSEFIEAMPPIPMKPILREAWEEWGGEIRDKQSQELMIHAGDEKPPA